MSSTTVMSMEPSISSSLAVVDPSLGCRRRRRLATEWLTTAPLISRDAEEEVSAVDGEVMLQ